MHCMRLVRTGTGRSTYTIMATRQRGSRDSSKQSPPPATVPEDAQQPSREQRIAIIAYLRAAERGFEPGHELDDWLAAEREIATDGGLDRAQM